MSEKPTSVLFTGYTVAHYNPLTGLVVQDALMSKQEVEQRLSALSQDDRLECVAIPMQITIPIEAIKQWTLDTYELRRQGFERLAEDVLRFPADENEGEANSPSADQ